MKNIFFIGNGHGGRSALKGLQKRFEKIGILSKDDRLRRLARKGDFLYHDLCDITEKFGVMAGNLEILPSEFILNHTTLNIHYSLLPHLRGLHSVAWAILNGDTEIGWTVHKVEERIDAGPIYYQKKIIYNRYSSTEIMSIFDAQVEEKIGEIVQSILDGKKCPRLQNEANATWVAKRNLDDCLIDFEQSTEYLNRFFLALVRPYPLPSILIKNTKFEVSQMKLIKRKYCCTNGRVVNIDNDGVYIKCSDGLLIISEILDHEYRAIDPRTYLRLGTRLG